MQKMFVSSKGPGRLDMFIPIRQTIMDINADGRRSEFNLAAGTHDLLYPLSERLIPFVKFSRSVFIFVEQLSDF